jgi:hypothetical protein
MTMGNVLAVVPELGVGTSPGDHATVQDQLAGA